jgi:hypothetical protein
MIKTIFILSAFLVLTIQLHLPHFASIHQVSPYQSTDMHLNHLQETTNKTDPKQIQSHLDLITNQVSLLEQAYKQASSLADIEAISNDGTLIKCKKISSEDQVYLKHTL